jgi:hypothetical protein
MYFASFETLVPGSCAVHCVPEEHHLGVKTHETGFDERAEDPVVVLCMYCV